MVTSLLALVRRKMMDVATSPIAQGLIEVASRRRGPWLADARDDAKRLRSPISINCTCLRWMCVTPMLLAVGCVESTRRIGEPVPPPMPITQALTLSDLRERPIVGDLGKPLGVCCELEATIFRGSDLNTKGSEGRYMLRVTSVDGTVLAKPILMDFTVPGFVQSNLVNDDMALYEKVNGKSSGPVSNVQIQALEKDYVGRPVRVCAYEKGGFSGMPNTLPKDAPVWQDHGFYFETWLVVLIDRSN